MLNKQKLSILILSFAATMSHSEPKQEPAANPDKSPRQTQPKQEQQQKPAPKAKTYDYEATEKIKADSAVAFPVDI